ncbi:hypothetical protein N783_11800 [Pontibacillus marinus BH030004 = DSM 16465]|uniref:Uncharacterized protein n=1 Tax=Pontibacillus marinus BH030004 = DSM 16465 TaxID=1385511 RepID=A0A0A5G668_9BACI|nr:hypothetical protein N783_11800 [Pontibacillus marinus BH030004 = DSM 16465]
MGTVRLFEKEKESQQSRFQAKKWDQNQLKWQQDMGLND